MIRAPEAHPGPHRQHAPARVAFYRNPRYIDPAVLLGLVLAFFWKLVFTRQYTTVDNPDIGTQVLPWLQVQALALHHYGTIALWDPFAYFGQSLIGQVQPGVTSPFTYILTALPLTHGHINLQYFYLWFVLIHYCAALFAWFFFRDLGVSRAAAVIAGLFYSIGGFIGTDEWPQLLTASIWAPLVFLFLLRSLRGRRPLSSAAFAGFFLGCAWLSGHHQPPLYIALAAISIPLYLLCIRWSHRHQIVLRSAIFLAVTGLTSLVQLLPAAEYGPLSLRWTASGALTWRQIVGVAEHEQYSLRAWDLVHFILPGGGSTIDPIIGVVAAILAALAVMALFHRLEVRLFATLGLAIILLSMARNDVLYGLFYTFVPLIEKSRSPVRMLGIAQLCIAVLVAFGIDVFLNRVRPLLVARTARWAGIFGTLIFALWFLKPGISNLSEGDDRPMMIAFIALLLAALFTAYSRGLVARRTAAVCLTILLMIELGNSIGYYWPHKSETKRWIYVDGLSSGDELAGFLRRQPQPLRTSANRDDLPVNFGDWYGINTVEAYLASMFSETADLPWWTHRLSSMLGVNYFVGRKPPAEVPVEDVFTAANGIKVFRNPDAFPRAWSVHQLTRIKDPKAALRLVAEGPLDLRTAAVISEPPPPLDTCAEADQIGLIHEAINTADLDVTMACRGFLVLSDSWFPGWVATVDGSSTPIFKTNTAIRGIAVEKGRHHIRFVYRPLSVYFGLLGTLTGLALVLFLWRRPELPGADLFPADLPETGQTHPFLST